MLRYLLTDNESLGQYINYSFCTFDDIKRRLFLKDREQDRAIPDHYYRLKQEDIFRNTSSINDLFTRALPALASEYLEVETDRVFVQPNRMNDWQELITFLPPLFLQSSLLYKDLFAKKNDNDIAKFYLKYILPNTKYTALPSPRIIQLDHWRQQQKGLHDLHMHLNGSLEVDILWQDYLKKPYSVYKELNKVFSNPQVREQLEQESHLFYPSTYFNLLKTAQKLRSFFFNYCYSQKSTSSINKQFLLINFLNSYSNEYAGNRHPFVNLITNDIDYPNTSSIECLMYLILLDEMQKNKSEVLASFFHFYLLILGLTNRLLVQQVHQKGFEQFQKHTLNGLREHSEKIYKRRYYQIHGNDAQNIHFVEGRLSPKKTKAEMILFIEGILGGWEKMKMGLPKVPSQHFHPVLNPTLKLIAHFIKAKDKKPDLFIRHKKLRSEVWLKAKVLSLLLKNYPKYKRKIVAVDAAASEFDAPPEVFAPAFRYMRRWGMKHFTYHAGEDFFHIISGLRAIYEAIIFCDLRKGDRIGHATATGLSVKYWCKQIGNEILIRQGEYLDNLIFAYHIIINLKIDILQQAIPLLVNKIQELSFEIYNEFLPVPVLEKAWTMRQCCPTHALSSDKSSIEFKKVYNEEEWNFCSSNGFEDRNIRTNRALQVYDLYHSRKCSDAYNKITTINPTSILDSDSIEQLQLSILDFMNKSEIVIETLPTSNIRIGFHKDFKTYHLWNWIKWKNEGRSIPPIVVGTDDTGIFATNIYNEYANIYCFLLNDCHLSHSQVVDVIKQLDEDSHIYRFE